MHDFLAADCEEELVSAALRDETDLLESGQNAKQHCCWLWLLFLSPFPLVLVRSQTTITLKYWKVICAILGTLQSGNGSGIPNSSSQQLLYMALIANKLVKSLLSSISKHDGTLPETEERNIVYLFAMVVPVLSALCKGLHQIAEATDSEERQQQNFFSNSAKSAVSKCMTQVRELFLVAFAHTHEKVVQTAVSSAQSLLQGVACADMFSSAIVPCLMLSLVTDRPMTSPAVVEAAWGVLSSVAVGRQGNEDGSPLLEATTPMVLKLVFCIADHTRKRSGSFQAHIGPMAQCLVQAARSNPQGLKAQVAAMPSGSQQMIQQLLKEHMSMPHHGTGAADGKVTSTSSVAANKIELKLKF